jgi:hypothetical protein
VSPEFGPKARDRPSGFSVGTGNFLEVGLGALTAGAAYAGPTLEPLRHQEGTTMKRLLAAILLACAPAAADAETFTFKVTSTPIDRVMWPASNGLPVGASMFNSTSVTTYADGKVTTTKGKCSNWGNPPGAQFFLAGACSYSDASGEIYTAEFSCRPAGKPQEADCWGRLNGLGGAFKGRTGLIAFHTGGKGGGAGLWND